MPLLPKFVRRRSPERFQVSYPRIRRLRRLFLEPLEDRRMLTFGWGSTTASGSHTGEGVTWGWGNPTGDGGAEFLFPGEYGNEYHWVYGGGTVANGGATEGDDIVLNLGVSIPYINGNLIEDWGMEYWIEDVSAIEGPDYYFPSGPGWQSVTVNQATGYYIYIPTIDDVLDEGTQSFKIHLRLFGTPESECVVEAQIWDNDLPTSVITFEAQTTSATEGNDVLLNVTSTQALPFEYRVENVLDSAVNGTDFTGATEWTAIDGSGQVAFPTADDTDAEGAESFKVFVRVQNQPATEMLLEADILDNEIVNNAPIANNDSFSTAEDTPKTVTPPGILDNDIDIDDDDLTAYFSTGPAHGVLTLLTNGSFTYTPDANYNGPDDFTYRASDGLELSNVATVAITITSDNDAPVATADAYTTAQDTPLQVAATGVLTNDTDADGDTLTAAIAANPAHGSVSLNSTAASRTRPPPAITESTASPTGPATVSFRAARPR